MTMPLIHGTRLISLTDAFERTGKSYITGWNGEEREVASLGQRTRQSLDVWKRARAALSILRENVRDGRLGLIAYDERGGRMLFFNQAREELSALLLSPDVTAPGYIEFSSGT